MNILKTLATAIIGIIVVILLGGLFIDGTYSVQREITINKPVGMSPLIPEIILIMNRT